MNYAPSVTILYAGIFGLILLVLSLNIFRMWVNTAMGASGMSMPGMDKMMKAMQGVNGLPVLTEMDMTIEGTGQMADMMRQMGAMKITTKVLSVKTDSISDDTFKVPEGYQVIK